MRRTAWVCPQRQQGGQHLLLAAALPNEQAAQGASTQPCNDFVGSGWVHGAEFEPTMAVSVCVLTPSTFDPPNRLTFLFPPSTLCLLGGLFWLNYWFCKTWNCWSGTVIIGIIGCMIL